MSKPTSEAANVERPRVPLKDRKAYLAEIPWVRYLNRHDGRKACQKLGYRGEPCKIRAQWRVTALNEELTGFYCWRHACDLVMDDSEEYARFDAWATANPPYWMLIGHA